MDFSLLISNVTAVGQCAVLGIASIAASVFAVDTAQWAYYEIMGMLDDAAARRMGLTRYDYGDASYDYLSAQDIEDYEYLRDRDASRWGE